MAADQSCLYTRAGHHVTVYIAAVSNNKRIGDLRADWRDLRTEMREGFHKIEEHFEHPIARP